MIGNPTRPGDLAVIIKSECPENIGAMVEVVGVGLFNGGCDRLARAMRRCAGTHGPIEPGQIEPIFDAMLQPIRPPSPEEQGERAEHLVGVV